MEINEEHEEIIKRKAQFYFSLNLNCHIRLKPAGFMNGKIISEFIEDGQYFMFEDIRSGGKPERLFIYQIYDIKDYEAPE